MLRTARDCDEFIFSQSFVVLRESAPHKWSNKRSNTRSIAANDRLDWLTFVTTARFTFEPKWAGFYATFTNIRYGQIMLRKVIFFGIVSAVLGLVAACNSSSTSCLVPRPPTNTCVSKPRGDCSPNEYW